MPSSHAGQVWAVLEANAHLRDIQEIIRAEIQCGRIRVRPGPEGGICILPLDGSRSSERTKLYAKD
jgi:hypothetical protein